LSALRRPAPALQSGAMRPPLRWALVGTMLLLAACGRAIGGQSATPSAVLMQPSPVSPAIVPSPGSASNGDAQAAIAAALADAAAHLGVSIDSLHVDQVEPRQWDDSSLGCPSTGLLYSQIITPGFLFVISGAGRQLEYHTDLRGRVVLCEER
jgi:hypothetical protein